MRFLNSVTVPKIVEGGPFEPCETPAGCKTFKKLKEGPFRAIQKFSKNFQKISRTVPKKVGLRVTFGVFSRFWTCFVFSFRFRRASEVRVS